MNDVVEYRDIPGFPGYRAGSDGSIWSNRCRRDWVERRLVKDRRGYLAIDLSVNHHPVRCRVHHLVLLAFVGPRQPGTEARHFPDPTKTNNAANNLSWGTHQENIEDSRVLGILPIGERAGGAKLTADEVVEIRRLRHEHGITHRKLAKQFGIGRSQVQRICARKKWKHIA